MFFKLESTIAEKNSDGFKQLGSWHNNSWGPGTTNHV